MLHDSDAIEGNHTKCRHNIGEGKVCKQSIGQILWDDISLLGNEGFTAKQAENLETSVRLFLDGAKGRGENVDGQLCNVFQ
ncbi:hypothetical protein P22_2755 [Propionispora sp. 2/2-37]|nr:hypothetical protein P22_2755 [Propionispora sp. 2/2-37]